MKLFIALITIIVIVIAVVVYSVMFALKIKYLVDKKNQKKS